MRQAIDGRQFIVEYQPIVHVRSGTVLALESLVRWNHPELGRLLPDDFIRVAEHTGLVNPLTSFVLERALTDWPLSERPDSCGIAVNVSPRSLHHAAFPGRIREMLDAHGMPPVVSHAGDHREPGDVGSGRRRRAASTSCTTWACSLVIDDFGKGYSSLSYLRRLPVDEIKIDRSFILGLADGEDDTLVRCIIDLAHNLGLTVVAEGVETEAVLEQLRRAQLRRRPGLLTLPPGARDGPPELDRPPICLAGA